MSRNSSRTQVADALQSVGGSAKSAAQDVAAEMSNVASAIGGAGQQHDVLGTGARRGGGGRAVGEEQEGQAEGR
jgi:hypothetical protein